MHLIAGCDIKSKNNTQTTKSNPKDQALLSLSSNQLDEAATGFQEAIKNNPEDISSYIYLTKLYLLKKNYDAADNLAKQGLKINPAILDLKLLLAETLSQKHDTINSVKELNEIIKIDPKNVNAYYKLSELDPSNLKEDSRKYYLLKVQRLLPANILPRLQLAEILANQSKTDSSLFYLQSIKKIAPGFSDAAEASYQKAASLLEANKPLIALTYIRQFHDLMKITPEYATGSDEVEIPNMIAGYFDFNTNISVSSFDTVKASKLNKNNPYNSTLEFKDISEIFGIPAANFSNVENTVLSVGDYDANGNMYIYSSYLKPGATSSKPYLLISQMGSVKECNVVGGIDHKGQDLDAAFADYDNDGFQDLFVATTDGIIVYKSKIDGTFTKVTEDIGLHHATTANKILFADFDQDGDLDLFVAQKGGNLFFRNNGDGTFSENIQKMGLTGNNLGVNNMDFGDWDDDGDLDILALKEDSSIALYNNNRHSNFNDIADSVGLQLPKYTGTVIAMGDYNNDGRLDIIIAGESDGKCLMLRNNGANFIADDKVSAQLSSSLIGIHVHQVAFVDYDNDGHEDIVVAGINHDSSKRGVRLFHNDGLKGFRDVSALLPVNVMQAFHVAVSDFNFDGDRDFFFSGPEGIQLARNDGGNYNNYVQVQLTGLSFGNSKNNRLGVGARIELKSGNLYQLKTVKGPLTEFGVGSRTKIDGLRIIWPNGVPQTIMDPIRKLRMLEEAQLKGSCPFLFTWNGTKFEFLKDMLWRSALGMPIAIHGNDTTYAYANPSKEYLRIPGEKLKPKNGLYSLKISEELWEAVYFDKTALVAVDHPDTVDAYVDERFVAPPYPGRKLYLISQKHLPVSAIDGNGNNVLPKLSKYDFQYVSNFSLGKFQGLSKSHDLILDLGKDAHADSVTLFMRGWIFPSDASINTELSQTKKYQLYPPCLQVINKEGKWQTVIKNIGYPMGRDKMVILNLSGKFLTTDDRRIRIRTNMQIYWDHIFFSVGQPRTPVNMIDLKMVGAQLHYRGYSFSYPKGGPYGPQWFDYYHVTKGQKWRDLTGNYTRYGNVMPLLEKADDEYIIADGGDEVSIDFDAKHLPLLPKGWKRDFLIYSEGWVKDGDLNTAYGQTVAPLPFHKMPSYPYGGNIHYPTDQAHREYQQKYNTRKVTTADFKNALRLGSFENAPK